MSTTEPGEDELSLTQLKIVSAVRDLFEAELKAHRRPRAGDHLACFQEPVRGFLDRELRLIEQEYPDEPAPLDPAVPPLVFLSKDPRNCVTLRHGLIPLGLTSRDSAKNCVILRTLRHSLIPLGLTATGLKGWRGQAGW
jgi:hypothetical protein